VSERVVALSTVGSAEDAERIARALVERRLAACVNVVPGMVSVYRWKGGVERDEERLLVIKTRADRLVAGGTRPRIARADGIRRAASG
jgi:periplasmic divalent cation tolerance protein